MSKTLGAILLIGATYFLIRTAVTNPLSADSFTHLGIGQYIVINRHIPDANDLSFKISEPSLEWVTHSWLGDTILYLAGSIQPVFAVSVLLLPLFFLSMWITHRILRSYMAPVTVELMTFSVISIIAASFWKLHPMLFSIPLSLSLITLTVVEHKNERIYWLIPIIFFIWANVNGGLIIVPMIFLFLVVSLNLLWRLIQLLLSKPAKMTRMTNRWYTLPLVFIVSIIATTFTPLGFRLWGYPFTFVTLLWTVRSVSSLPGAIIAINQNFVKATPSSELYAVFLIYSITLTAAFIAGVVNKTHIFITRYWRTVPLLLFLALGFFWVRLIPLAVFGSAPLLAILLSDVRSRVVWTFAYGSLMVLTGYLILFPPVQLNIRYPQKQVNLIKELNLSPTILTSFDYTGYVLYMLPDQKVALDAQDDLFDENALLSIYSWPTAVKTSTVQTITTRYNVNTILVSKNVGGLAASLTRNPNWALIYFDTSGFLFVKKTSVSQNFLDTNALKYVDLTRNLGADPAHIPEAITELEIFTAKYPESSLALGQLASLYRAANDVAKAEAVLKRIPRETWDYTIYTEMGRLKAAEGLCIPARDNFLKALRDRSEQNYSRTVLDLAVLDAGCLGNKEEAKHYFLRYNSFLLTPPEREKLHEIMTTFGMTLE